MQKALDIRILSRVPIFDGMRTDELEKLLGVAQVRDYARGALIFSEGDPGNAMLILLSGAVKVHRLSPDGREVTLAILRAGDCLGEMSLLDGLSRSASADAIEHTTALEIRRDDFLRLLRSRPEMSLAIIQILAARLRQTDRRLEHLVLGDARSRVLGVLLDLAAGHGVPYSGGTKIDIRLTHQEIAELAGIARETASRILSELADEGLIQLDERHIIVNASARESAP